MAINRKFIVCIGLILFTRVAAWGQSEPFSDTKQLFEQQQLLANRLWQRGDFTTAKLALNRALELEPQWVAGWRQLAITEKALGDRTHAKQHLAHALEIDAQDAASHFSRGLILKEEGSLVAALEDFRAAAKFDPQDAFARIEMARLLQQQGDLDKAIHLLHKAIELDPASGATTELAAILHTRATLEAQYVLKVKRLTPFFSVEDALGSFDLDVINRDTGDEASLAIYQGRISANKKDASAYYALGILLRARGRLTEATKALRTAVELTPDNVDLFNALGLSLQKQGDLNGAMLEFRTALDSDVDDYKARVNIANIFRARKDYASAERELRVVIKQDSNNMLVRQNLAHTLLDSGQVTAALEEMSVVLKLQPNNALAHSLMATIQAKAGQAKESILSLRTATDLSPTDSQLLLDYVAALQGQRRYEDAADSLQHYLQIVPDSSQTTDIKKRILKLRQLARGW